MQVIEKLRDLALNRKLAAVSAIMVVFTVAASSYAVLELSHNGSSSQGLIVYSADAYVQESNTMLNGFHNTTGYPVAPAIGAGSYSAARSIGQGAPADIFISVAQGALDRSYLLSRYSGWAVAFASDQLVLAYSSATISNAPAKSVIAMFSQANASNSSTAYYAAFSNLTSGAVKVGIANPSDDPAGLRGWLALEIAGYLYDRANVGYFVNATLRNNASVSSLNAALLVEPLEAGYIQFLFIYKSAAIANGLGFISLPASINQGEPGMSSFYNKFTYTLPTGTVRGSPIFLYATVLANSSRSPESYAFLGYLVNNTNILSGFGLSPLQPCILFSSVQDPPEIAALVSEGHLAYGGPL